jgi:hypothetical protein
VTITDGSRVPRVRQASRQASSHVGTAVAPTSAAASGSRAPQKMIRLARFSRKAFS